MALLKDLDEFDRIGKIGDWCFVNGETHIAIQLGENKFINSCVLPILKKGDAREITGVYWDWNGDKNSPTLTPSILHWGYGRHKPSTWHGYMTDGKLIEC